jgi:hypothetical protein
MIADCGLRIADCGFMNLFNSGLKIEIEYFINPQSAIRNPQSAIRNPQSYSRSFLCSPLYALLQRIESRLRSVRKTPTAAAET